MPFPHKRNEDSLEKWMIPGLKQGRYKVNLEHLVMLESESAKKETNNKQPVGYITRTQEPVRRESQWSNQR